MRRLDGIDNKKGAEIDIKISKPLQVSLPSMADEDDIPSFNKTFQLYIEVMKTNRFSFSERNFLATASRYCGLPTVMW